MSDYNKEAKTPDLVKIKIENLQKVCTEYSDQKRKKLTMPTTAHLTTLLISMMTTTMSKNLLKMYQCPL